MSKDYTEYIEKDPFNPQNTLEVSLCRLLGKHYGALDIYKVNGNEISQPKVWATPKLEYPFNMSGKFHFPSASKILCYEKLDGTNIFAYRYRDDKGYTHITYKVRTFPFLRGRFLNMWKEVLKKHPRIPKLFLENPDISGFSFELYGANNPHLIEYKEELETKLLFGVKGEGEIVPVKELNSPDVPTIRLTGTVDRDYVWNYQQKQELMGSDLEYSKPLPDGTVLMKGDEGEVWFMKEKETDLWKMYKCKPHEIENLHWSNYMIPLLTIKATADNVLEVDDKITVDNLTNLLLEEFPLEQIELSKRRLIKIIGEFEERFVFAQGVKDNLDSLGFSVDEDELTDILIAFSKNQIYYKNEMRKVHYFLSHLDRYI